jgi:hypothetical protein
VRSAVLQSVDLELSPSLLHNTIDGLGYGLQHSKGNAATISSDASRKSSLSVGVGIHTSKSDALVWSFSRPGKRVSRLDFMVN